MCIIPCKLCAANLILNARVLLRNATPLEVQTSRLAGKSWQVNDERRQDVITQEPLCEPLVADLASVDIELNLDIQYCHSARPMHISVGCMRLDIGVMVNLALCKVNAPLTIVESRHMTTALDMQN